MKKGVSVESLLDKIPLSDQSEPSMEPSAKISLGAVMENSTIDQAGSRPGSRRDSGNITSTTRPSTRTRSRPGSRASSSDRR